MVLMEDTMESRYANGVARYLNVVLGAWLFISAFLWPHSAGQFENTWILGIICVALALIAMGVPWARFGNTLLAIWLFISTLALPRDSVATMWNNLLVALAIFVVSLLPGAEAPSPYYRRPQRPRPA
jgi:hypothetical protein